MKIFLIHLLVFCTLLGCKSNSKEKLTIHNKSKCVVQYVDLTTETFSSVSCQSFTSTFSKLKQKTFFEGDHYFILIDSLCSFYEPVEEENINVRLKVVLMKTSTKNVMCMDKFGKFYDSSTHKLFRNEPLRKVLSEITE